MFPTPIAQTSKLTQMSYKAALPITIILWLLPLAAVLMTSVRSMADINAGNYWGIPESFNLIQNYSAVFGTTNMGRYLLNSILVTVPVMFGSVLLATLAGFGLAKFKFKGRLAVFALFIGGNFVPFQILMIPVRDLTISLGMYDTVWALIIFHLAFQTGFCTMFMRNFIIGIPDELLESCRLEGSSEWQIFYKIILPLVRPALAALAVLIFTFVWNDYFWALVLVQSDEVRPVTAGISALRGQWLASWNLISAGSIVAALPPVILFFAMQKHFIAGLTLGATKG
ncbi:carbohydrate ABC transporter permease [Reinekea sp.]|jgi:multiple sugar transport system permease protein|uniref:carbohydrate ABC transporter permease n=1 Tax=Reinekea sp. TaxID=1970455 RepID=UPI00398952F3